MPSTTFEYTTPGNYDLSDAAKIEISGGNAQLKDLTPTDSTFYANYASDINGTWGSGTLTGTATGGAAVSGGKLDLAHSDVRYVSYDADLNADSQQTGCVRLRFVPNYTGAPGVVQIIFDITKQAGSTFNQIQFSHGNTGQMALVIRDSAGTLVVNLGLGGWVPTSGTTYEWEVNWDITNGATRVFLDGVQIGSTNTSTGTRDANIGLFRIGSSTTGTQTSNFEIEDIIVFSSVQHTANYTPTDWSEISATRYSLANPYLTPTTKIRADKVTGISETLATPLVGSDAVKYVVKVDALWYYLSGGVITVTDGTTYAESNTKAEWDVIWPSWDPVNGVDIYIRPFLHSDDGSTTPQLDQNIVTYNFHGDEADTISYCTVWGHAKDGYGNSDTRPIKFSIAQSNERYGSNTRIQGMANLAPVTPRESDAYWEKPLIQGLSYNIKYPYTSGPKTISIPAQASVYEGDL